MIPAAARNGKKRSPPRKESAAKATAVFSEPLRNNIIANAIRNISGIKESACRDQATKAGSIAKQKANRYFFFWLIFSEKKKGIETRKIPINAGNKRAVKSVGPKNLKINAVIKT